MRVTRIRITLAHVCVSTGIFPRRGLGCGFRCHTRVLAAGWDAAPCDIPCPRPSPAQGNACAEPGRASELRPG